MAFYSDLDRRGASRISQFFAGFRARRAQAREVARIRRELREMSDRELNDLGLGRGDIDDVARRSVSG